MAEVELQRTDRYVGRREGVRVGTVPIGAELRLSAGPLNGRLELSGLVPEPQEEWHRMLRFVALDEEQKVAMSRSIEVLFRRGPELVVQTYDYLRSVPETAAILGWEQEVDPEHLEERRRFFTVWLARTLGLDTSDEFALYLFRAGKFHAGHGPRRIHVPPAYVTGSMGLVLATFARYMSEAHLPPDVIAAAMAGWSKYLMVQLNQMDLGYRVAKELEAGDIPVRCVVFGRLRSLLGIQELEVRAERDASVGDVLRKFFNYFPQARLEALDRIWHGEERVDSTWVEVLPAYVPRRGWLFLLNGRDLYHAGGFTAPVRPHDEVAIFPPGR